MGPVWQFTTRGIGNVDRLEFGPLAINQVVDVPFGATVSARDDIDNIETNFIGSVTLQAYRGSSNVSTIVITEVDAGTNDRIEFMNVSGRRINISNWQITTYDALSWPAPQHDHDRHQHHGSIRRGFYGQRVWRGSGQVSAILYGHEYPVEFCCRKQLSGGACARCQW